MTNQITYTIGVDLIPYRIELDIICLLLSVILVSYILFVAYFNTPLAMIRYRLHIIDSLLSCCFFSAVHIIWFSPYIFKRSDQPNILLTSNSFVSLIFPRISFKLQMLLYTYTVVNAIRSTIFCFKYRFEIVVYGKLKKLYMKIRYYLIFGMIIYAIPCFYFVAYDSSEPTEDLGILHLTTLLPPFESINISPNNIILSITYILPLMFIAVLYIAAFIFYIVATNWLLYSSKTVAKQQSKKTLAAQRLALSMLMIQSLCTLGAGLIPCGFTILVAITKSQIIILLFNVSTALVLMPYGFLYPIVILLTTRPYLDFTMKLLLGKLSLVSLQSLRTTEPSTQIVITVDSKLTTNRK